MLKRTDATTNGVLEPMMIVLTYPTVIRFLCWVYVSSLFTTQGGANVI